MPGDTIQADIDEIRAFSKMYDEVAEKFAAIDSAPVSKGVASAFAGGAQVVTALDEAADSIRRATLMFADRAWSTSDTANRIAENLENTDQYFGDELRKAAPE